MSLGQRAALPFGQIARTGRLWWTAVLALLLFVLPLSAHAQAAAGGPPTAPAEVTAHEVAPGDAPQPVAGKTLTIPAPPASFNVHDGGWIKFAYLPAVRERVQPLITEADAVRAELTERFGRPVLSRSARPRRARSYARVRCHRWSPRRSTPVAGQSGAP
jgi:hypothetical protein